MNKNTYKRKIYAKIEKAAFLSYIERKENQLGKLVKLEYIMQHEIYFGL